jgi:hypothetical protein
MNRALDELEAAVGPTPDPAPRRRLPRLDPVELAALAVFALLSLWTVAVDLWQVVDHHAVWTGTDGVYITDQMQYLAWIRSASHHVLISNMYVLRSSPADYFQPTMALSAGLVALGVVPWLALILWKPIAVVCTFLAFRSFVHHSLPGRVGRRVALILGLFFGSYTLVYGSWSVVGDLMPVFLTWGYTFGLIAGALMVWALVVYARAREGERLTPWPGVLAGTAALLHPWQGELTIAIVIGTELVLWWSRGRSRPGRELLRTPLLTLVLTALPLLYFLILDHADINWSMARDASKHNFSISTILLGTAALLVPALVAWRPKHMTPLAVITRVWPLAAIAVWVFSASAAGATPLHAFQGVTLPLAVLAVEGAQRLHVERIPRGRLVLVPLLLLLTVPAMIKLMNIGQTLVKPSFQNANFIAPQERDALHYLAHAPRPGGVLTRFYLGDTIPAETDRQTWLGDCLWSNPGCGTRINQTNALMSGKMTPVQARAFVRATGARFVLTDCEDPIDLRSTLAPMLVSVHSFGCSAVYEVEPRT